MSANFDQIIGLKIADTVADRFDYCCSLSLLFTHNVFSFLVLFAKFVEVFCAGQILCWILPDFGYFLHFWGLPLILRFYLTNYISVCWLIDQLFGSAIMKNLQDNLAHSDVGRRFTYRLICIWLVPIASPFYVHQNFLNGSLNNIKSPRQLIVLEDFLIKDENREDLVVETMKRMKSISDKEEAGKDIGSYRKCFSKKPIIRTWIASMIWIE